MTLRITTSAIRLSTLLLVGAMLCWPQPQQLGISVGGEVFRLGMNKKEALARISRHGEPVTFPDSTVLIPQGKNLSDGFGGTLYFVGDKVSGIAADREFIQEPAAYETSLAFYRLLDGLTHGGPAHVTVYAHNLDTGDGTSKSVVMRFANGRLIRLQMFDINPRPVKFPQQVTISECAGKCTDW